MSERPFHPVILCGGAGARLWPASTPLRPKAFLALTGGKSLLQETALRVARAPGASTPIVVASAAHVELVRSQFADIGLECRIVSEPGGRGSAPAIAVAALDIAARDPDGLVLVVACDHHVPDADAFIEGVRASLDAAASGAIVTFGVKPIQPSGAYGHILPGAPAQGGVRHVAKFIEKPSLADAFTLTSAGWLWNSGNFVFAAKVMLQELKQREPELLAAVRRAMAESTQAKSVSASADLVLGAAFLAAPNVAIDVAVMEKTERAAVLPVNYAWTDLGAWDGVLEAMQRDVAGNAVQGDALVEDSHGCLIRVDPGSRVVAIGLKDIAVVVEDGRILVCDLALAQKVRRAAQEIDGA